jgi:hypothetical protein
VLRIVAASLALTLLFAVAACAQDSALAAAEQEWAAAREAILEGLSQRDRDYALAMAKLNGPPILNLRGMKLLRGQIGLLGETVDEQADGRRPLADSDARLVVRHVVDDDEILIANGQILLEGIDAASVVDGHLPQLGGVIFQVQGQRRHSSQGAAARSVWHLKTLDVSMATAAAEKLRALKTYRTWRSESGETLRPAKFMAFKRGRVTFEYLDGQTGSRPLPRLSKADQDFVRQAVKDATARKSSIGD